MLKSAITEEKKFHRPLGAREEDVYRILPYMGMVAILIMRPKPFEQAFVTLFQGDSA